MHITLHARLGCWMVADFMQMINVSLFLRQLLFVQIHVASYNYDA